MSRAYNQQVFGQLHGPPFAQAVPQYTTGHIPTHAAYDQQRSLYSHGASQYNPVSTSSNSPPIGFSGGTTFNGGQVGGNSYQQTLANTSYVCGEGALNESYSTSGSYFGSTSTVSRRPGRRRQQVIRLPDQGQGSIRQRCYRMPTPEPDTLERVYIQRAANEIVEEITEVPTTPPPIVQERTVVEPSGPPKIIKKVVRVPPRSGSYQQQGSFSSNIGRAIGNVPTESYTNFQQCAGDYRQYSGITSTGSPVGYSSSGYGAPIGGFQQRSSSYSGGPYHSLTGTSVTQPATCFYL